MRIVRDAWLPSLWMLLHSCPKLVSVSLNANPQLRNKYFQGSIVQKFACLQNCESFSQVVLVLEQPPFYRLVSKRMPLSPATQDSLHNFKTTFKLGQVSQLLLGPKYSTNSYHLNQYSVPTTPSFLMKCLNNLQLLRHNYKKAECCLLFFGQLTLYQTLRPPYHQPCIKLLGPLVPLLPLAPRVASFCASTFCRRTSSCYQGTLGRQVFSSCRFSPQCCVTSINNRSNSFSLLHLCNRLQEGFCRLKSIICWRLWRCMYPSRNHPCQGIPASEPLDQKLSMLGLNCISKSIIRNKRTFLFLCRSKLRCWVTQKLCFNTLKVLPRSLWSLRFLHLYKPSPLGFFTLSFISAI